MAATGGVHLTVPLPASPEAGFTPSSGQNSPESAASPTSRGNNETPLSTVILPHEKRKKKPYKELTLEEKVRLIKMAEENNCMSQASIAERYSIAKSNVCRILQRKHEYLRAFESAGFAGTRKRKLRNDSIMISREMKSTKKQQREEKRKSNDDGFILKPIPRKILLKDENDNKKESSIKNENQNDVCRLFLSNTQTLLNSINESTTKLTELCNGPNEQQQQQQHKSAFRNLTPPKTTSNNFYDPNIFAASQFLSSSFPSLSYSDETILLQAKTLSNPAMNLFLNHALSKQIEFLNEKLAIYEQKQGKFRTFVQNAETAGLASSSDAQRLLHSLMSLL